MSVIEREQRLRFDDPAATVLRMLSDVDFYREKYKALGFSGVDVREDSKGGHNFGVVAAYRAASELPIPKWAQRALPQQMDVEQRDSWDVEAGEGALDIGIGNVPVKVTARMTLKATADGCENRLQWQFSCGMPLLGKRIAEFIADDVCAKAERDHEHVRQAIARYRD